MTEKTYEDGIEEERKRIAFLIDEQWDAAKGIPDVCEGDGGQVQMLWYIQALADLRRKIGEGVEATAMSPYLKALYEIDAAIPFDADKEWSQECINECLAILKRVMPKGCPDDLFPKDQKEQ
jgi:hypothetical protein